MSKRQMVEDTVEGPSESMAKRSRVDISDLLGHAAEAGPYNNTVDASHRDGQNSGGNESATDNHTATNRGEAAKDGSGGLTISIDLPPATGHAMTQSTRPAVKFKKPPNAVYIALQRLENHREEESMQGDILGVFGDVERANQTVQREFLENYDPDDRGDQRQRYYGEHGELTCSFDSECPDISTMTFWVERHVVESSALGADERDETAAEFDRAFKGHDD